MGRETHTHKTQHSTIIVLPPKEGTGRQEIPILRFFHGGTVNDCDSNFLFFSGSTYIAHFMHTHTQSHPKDEGVGGGWWWEDRFFW